MNTIPTAFSPLSPFLVCWQTGVRSGSSQNEYQCLHLESWMVFLRHRVIEIYIVYLCPQGPYYFNTGVGDGPWGEDSYP